jgi:hypothetical protein
VAESCGSLLAEYVSFACGDQVFDFVVEVFGF